MSRWLVGMSGDKDAMIRHLEKCEKRMLEQFKDISTIAMNVIIEMNPVEQENMAVIKEMRDIIALCDVYLDKRSDKQKMQDQIDEMQKKIEKMAGDSECGCC